MELEKNLSPAYDPLHPEINMDILAEDDKSNEGKRLLNRVRDAIDTAAAQVARFDHGIGDDTSIESRREGLIDQRDKVIEQLQIDVCELCENHLTYLVNTGPHPATSLDVFREVVLLMFTSAVSEVSTCFEDTEFLKGMFRSVSLGPVDRMIPRSQDAISNLSATVIQAFVEAQPMVAKHPDFFGFVLEGLKHSDNADMVGILTVFGIGKQAVDAKLLELLWEKYPVQPKVVLDIFGKMHMKVSPFSFSTQDFDKLMKPVATNMVMDEGGLALLVKLIDCLLKWWNVKGSAGKHDFVCLLFNFLATLEKIPEDEVYLQAMRQVCKNLEESQLNLGYLLEKSIRTNKLSKQKAESSKLSFLVDYSSTLRISLLKKVFEGEDMGSACVANLMETKFLGEKNTAMYILKHKDSDLYKKVFNWSMKEFLTKCDGVMTSATAQLCGPEIVAHLNKNEKDMEEVSRMELQGTNWGFLMDNAKFLEAYFQNNPGLYENVDKLQPQSKLWKAVMHHAVRHGDMEKVRALASSLPQAALAQSDNTKSTDANNESCNESATSVVSTEKKKKRKRKKDRKEKRKKKSPKKADVFSDDDDDF